MSIGGALLPAAPESSRPYQNPPDTSQLVFVKAILVFVSAALLQATPARAQFGPPRQPDPEVEPTARGGPYVSYDSLERLEIQVDFLVRENSRYAATAAQMKASLPAGGKLHIYIEEKSEAAANPKNFTVRVTDKDGKELVKVTGRDQKPFRDGKPNLPWTGDISVGIPVKWSGTATVKVWNALTRKMWTYQVRAEARANAAEENKPQTD